MQSVRRWSLGDLQVIQDVLWKTWLSNYSTFIPEDDLKSYFTEHYDVEMLTDLYYNPLVTGFVAEVDGRVVGFMRTTRAPEERKYFVSSLYILPGFQGRGLGKELLILAAEEAQSMGLDRVWLGVMVQNEQAYRWYHSFGFQVVSKEPFTMGESLVDHYIGYVPVGGILSQKDSKDPATR